MIEYVLTRLFIYGCLGAGLLRQLRYSSAGRRTKWLHVFSVLFLLYIHEVPLRAFGKALVMLASNNGEVVCKIFRIYEGLLPASIALPVWGLVAVAGAAANGLPIAMYFGRSWARQALVRLLPWIYLLDSFTFYLQLVSSGPKNPANTIRALVFTQVLFAILFGWVYVVMLFFYRSQNAHCLFHPNLQTSKQLETA